MDSTSECTDGIDNDRDGLVDDNDPGCPFNGASEAPDPVACSDGIDNDGDGLIDSDDPGCFTDRDDDESHTPSPLCSDGIDNDGDGLMDYPNDPGCFLPIEDSEDDDCPGGDKCPACSNSVDDDGDGAADYPADPGCSHAADFDEFDIEPNACGGDLVVKMFPEQGKAVGTIRPGTPSALDSLTCGGDGPEVAWVVQVREPSTLRISTADPTTTADTIVYLRRDCLDPGSELMCNDDANEYVGASELLIDVAEPGPYYLIVDSANVGSTGGFRVMVERFTLTGASCNAQVPTCAPGQTCRPLDDTRTETLCLPPQCSDGHDNDGDGRADYPDEPGCTGAKDISEVDECPDGPMCPACSNGVDDDDDGLIDFPAENIGCSSASDSEEADECIAGVPVRAYVPGGVSGTTPSANSGQNNFTGSCDSSTNPPEHIYGVRVDQPLQSITFSTVGSSGDTVLHVRRGECAHEASEVACADPGPAGESITLDAPQQDIYFVFVDGDLASRIDYTLDIQGEIAPGASCDPQDTMFVCASGYACDPGSHTCRVAACDNGADDDGDGLADYPEEPGCQSISDDDEHDDCPDGPMCPACSNGVDDDRDGVIDDGADPGCLAAGDRDEIDACVSGVYPTRLPPEGITGTTPPTGSGSNFSPSCHNSTLSTEDVYYLPLYLDLTSLTFSTEGSVDDTVLSVRYAECGNLAAELDCNHAPSGGESITLDSPQQGIYYVFVDGDFASGLDYVLDMWGTIAGGSACDPDLTTLTCEVGYYCDPGTQRCEVAACANGVDDDGDGSVDYPDDAGCDSADDNDELDDCPSGPDCAACSNGVDDDGDGQIDYPLDPGCGAAGDSDESECSQEYDPVELVTAPAMTGDTTGLSHDFVPSCQSANSAPDKVYMLWVPGMLGELTVDTVGSSFDTVLAIKAGDCAAADLSCNDDGGSGSRSLLSLTDVPAGQYLIVVDGYSGHSGPYTLHVSGTLLAGEPCDPAQAAAGVLACPSGTACIDAGSGYRCQ